MSRTRSVSVSRRVDLTPERLTMRCRALSDVRHPRATVSTLRSFGVEIGRPGAVPA